MKKPDHEPLLKEILGDESLDALRDASLRRGLDALRQRRVRAQRFKGAAAIVLPFLLICAVAYQRRDQPVPVSVTQMAAPSAAPATSKVKFISKEELFALFPHRPIALIGKPGHQEVIFLDELAAAHRQ